MELTSSQNRSKLVTQVNSILRGVPESATIPYDYGVDFDGPLPDVSIGTVDVPETVNPLDDEQLSTFSCCFKFAPTVSI